MEEISDELNEHIEHLINAEYVKLIEGDIGLCTCQLFKYDLKKAKELVGKLNPSDFRSLHLSWRKFLSSNCVTCY